MAQNPIKYSWLTTTIAPEEVFDLCGGGGGGASIPYLLTQIRNKGN